MHFSKTYAQLLLSLPPELRENAIQYRQLKKLINQVVRELSSLGLSPAVLQELLEYSKNESDELVDRKGKKRSEDGEELDEEGSTSTFAYRHHLRRVVYEVTKDSGRIEPQLRLWVDLPSHSSGSSPHSLGTEEDSPTPGTETDIDEDDHYHGNHDGVRPQMSLLWALQRQPWLGSAEERRGHPTEMPAVRITEVLDDDPEHATLSYDDPILDHDQTPNEVVIPLAADMEFFQTLSTALEGLSAQMTTVQSDFVDTLESLSRTIANSAHPASFSSSAFRPHSIVTSKPWSINVSAKAKSDLYFWREIFQLYVEAEVFESVHELDRGERTVEESENRLKLFAERVTQRGLGDGRKLKLQSSREALETFLELNLFILNIKKFQFANSEATRKILKKHTKRTSLPLYPLVPRSQSTSLPRILVQAVGETLLPVIPHLDDYSCLICTSIAFKPIRLKCGHLFCVRCLVKMQKRGSGDCPMCRMPCVLQADRSNVDWALLNFMQDWFPIESKEKLQQNEREAAREELEELGLSPEQECRVM